MSKRSIYLSYSQRDSEIAARVEKTLRRLGFDAFNPARDVSPGEDWRKAIQAAVKRSDALILLITSPDSVVASWMSYEAGMAEALEKRVLVLASNRHSVSELPAELGGVPIVDLDPLAPERAAQHVVEELAAA